MKTKIAVNEFFGPPDVITITETEIGQPGSNQILVENHFSSVSTVDIRLRPQTVPRGFKLIMGLLFGFRKPRYGALGTDLGGRVIAVGSKVKNFKVGDRVVAIIGISLRGHSQHKNPNETLALAKTQRQTNSSWKVRPGSGRLTNASS